MDEEHQPSLPDFDWSPVDEIQVHFSPDEWWEREWKGHAALGQQLRQLIEDAVNSLEGLTSEQAEMVQESLKEWPEGWRWGTDWYYCKDAVERIVPMTNRFLKLSPVLTKVAHKRNVNVYLREATKCYLYGFFQASTALFRTALETGLKDCFDRKLGPSYGVKLYDRIGKAVESGLLTAAVAEMAHEVRKEANKVIHEEPVTEEQAFGILVKTRCVLEELYRP